MRISSVLKVLVGISLLVGIYLLIKIFLPMISLELDYQLNMAQGQLIVKRGIKPVNTDFGIVIPKIGVNAKVISKVNPYSDKDYQSTFTEGVAHALGSSVPGYLGNVFLFSYSSNLRFYLLDKMENSDEINLYYGGDKFKYLVTDKKIVNPQKVQYSDSIGPFETVTLMTGWPAGTTWKRLLIIGKLVETNRL